MFPIPFHLSIFIIAFYDVLANAPSEFLYPLALSFSGVAMFPFCPSVVISTHAYQKNFFLIAVRIS